MTDFWDGLIKELPVSIAVHLPWTWLLFITASFFLLRGMGVFEAAKQML